MFVYSFIYSFVILISRVWVSCLHVCLHTMCMPHVQGDRRPFWVWVPLWIKREGKLSTSVHLCSLAVGTKRPAASPPVPVATAAASLLSLTLLSCHLWAKRNLECSFIRLAQQQENNQYASLRQLSQGAHVCKDSVLPPSIHVRKPLPLLEQIRKMENN